MVRELSNKEDVIKFTNTIINYTEELNLTVLEAIMYHCDKTGLEIETAVSLMSPKLKALLKSEAETLNLVKKSTDITKFIRRK